MMLWLDHRHKSRTTGTSSAINAGVLPDLMSEMISDEVIR